MDADGRGSGPSPARSAFQVFAASVNLAAGMLLVLAAFAADDFAKAVVMCGFAIVAFFGMFINLLLK